MQAILPEFVNKQTAEKCEEKKSTQESSRITNQTIMLLGNEGHPGNQIIKTTPNDFREACKDSACMRFGCGCKSGASRG